MVRSAGLPVVFLHGLGAMSSIDFAGLDAALGGRRAWLVDMPGAGSPYDGADASIAGQARFVAGLLDADGVGQVVVFGHSMGGAVAVALAGFRPDLVAGLILAESNLDPGGGTWSRRIASMTETEFTAHGCQELIGEQQVECPSWAATLAMSSPTAVHRQAVSLVAGTKPSWRQVLYGLDCPRFYLFGERNLPDPDESELPRHGVRVRVVAGAGHNMAYDNPAGFADTLAGCLKYTP